MWRHQYRVQAASPTQTTGQRNPITTIKPGSAQVRARAAVDMTSAEKNCRLLGKQLGGCGGPGDRLVVDVDTAELAGGCGVDGANDVDDVGEAIRVDRKGPDAEDAGDSTDVGVDGQRTTVGVENDIDVDKVDYINDPAGLWAAVDGVSSDVSGMWVSD